MFKTNKTRLIYSVFAIIAALIAPLFGYAATPEELALGGLMVAGIGDIELTEIKGLLDEQGKAWSEFTRKNDELLKAKAEGKAVAELTETVEKINADLTKFNKEITEIAKKANRPKVGDGSSNLSEEEAEHKQAFRNFVRKGGANDLSSLEKKVFRRGSDVDGGYLIDKEMDADINRVAGTVSIMRSLAEVKPIGKESISMRVKTSGTAARWVGEGEAGGETTNAKYAKIEIVAEELEIEPWFYNSALDDADYDLVSDVVSEAGIGFGEAEGVAFITGNGVKKARGILGYTNVANSSYAWGKVGYIASGGAGAFAASNPGDNIINLLHGLKSAYRNGATLLMNDTTLASVRQIKDGSGNFYLFQPDVTGNFGGFVLGAPVQIDDNMPDIAANSYSIAYANFNRAYRIVDRSGITLIRDNITEKGTTKFNFRKRVGGGIKNFEAIKLMKFAAS